MDIDLTNAHPCPDCRQCLTTEAKCSYCAERDALRQQLAAAVERAEWAEKRATQAESMIQTWEAATRRTAEEDEVQYVGPNTASAISDKLRARAEAAEKRAEIAEYERDKDLADMRRFQGMVIQLTHRAEAAEATVAGLRKEMDSVRFMVTKGKLVEAIGCIEEAIAATPAQHAARVKERVLREAHSRIAMAGKHESCAIIAAMADEAAKEAKNGQDS